MAAPLVAMLLLGGTYYLARLAPRIAQREAARQAALRTTRQHVKPYHRYEGGFENPMSQREALLLLGFQEDAAGGSAPLPSEDEVKANYYKLIRQLHSDVDGSTYIAAKLNEARDPIRTRAVSVAAYTCHALEPKFVGAYTGLGNEIEQASDFFSPMHALPTFMEIASQLHAALDAAAGRLASGSHVGCSLALLPDVALRGLSHHWGVVELVGQGNSFQLVVGVGKEILVEAAASILGREHKQEGGMGANNNKLPLIGPVVDCLAHDTTALLLLLFPAHNSLWNARRRWLTFNVNRDSKNGGHGGSFLLHELLLTSLLVSFHHKMQEVWVHRWWVVQRLASRNVICAEVFHQHDRAVLLEASDKHRMNYHSWNYRRQAVTFYLLNTQGGSGGSALALSSITLLQEEVDTTIRFFETHNGDASAVSYLTFLLKQSQTIDSSCVFVRGMWAKLMTTTSRELRRHCDKGHEAVWVLRLALVHWAMKVRLACGWTLQDELDFVNLFAELPQWPCAEHVLNDRVTWEGVQGSWRGTSYYAAWYGSQLVKWLRAPF